MTKKPHVVDWFSKRRFGLFIHFGLYSIEGWHEQDQMRRRIPRADYEKLTERFNPVDFDAEAILDLAESAGMEYVCLTTKHHDGFCLWDTKQTDFNVMNTPYKKDIVRQLADACHKRNFPLGLYYSVADWHSPYYPNEGRHHELAGPEPGDTPNWDTYVDFLCAQVRELCTNYGEIKHFFWDINVPEYYDPTVNDMIRSLQPNIVINNRGFDDGDFGTPEREYSSDTTSRHSRFERFSEACNSVGTQSWGYRHDEDYYSTAFLIQSMDTVMAKGGHYLLNVGPDATGSIPAVSSTILKEIGAWYTKVKPAFSDTEPASNLTKNKDILLTRRGTTIYAHLNNPVTADAVTLAPIDTLPERAILLNTGESLECSVDVLPVHWKHNKEVLRIKGLPRTALSGDETLIVELQFAEELVVSTDEVQEFKG